MLLGQHIKNRNREESESESEREALNEAPSIVLKYRASVAGLLARVV